MEHDIPCTDIRQIKSVDQVREILEPLDVIFAVQRGAQQNKIAVYGLQFLRTIAAGLIGNQNCAVGGIIIDPKTEELEQLLAAVEVVKGFYEWEGEMGE